MKLVEEKLLEVGCPKIKLLVRATNTSVPGFYRRLGYAADG